MAQADLTRVQTACHACGSEDVDDRGEILHPDPALVAGVPIELGATGFRLLHCANCGFCFKDPPIAEHLLLDCYRRAKRDHWVEEADPVRRRFDTFRDTLARHAKGPRVLDIGCFNGSMLRYLGPQWERAGVEPSVDGAALARQRGVQILGATIADIPPDERFHAALAVDIVEHIVQPAPFFEAVARVLLPGGVFVVITGDTDAPTWRIEGSKYWYCSLPEHVSFFNRRSTEALGRRCGLRSVTHVRLSHDRAGPRERAAELLKNVAYIIGNRTGGLGIHALRRLFVERRAPGWLTARDHMLHVLERP